VKQRQQRQQLRRKLGPLEENLVKRITLQRYIDCFNLFTEYLSETRTTWPSTPAAFDLAMSEYLEVLWDEGPHRFFGCSSVLCSATEEAAPSQLEAKSYLGSP